MVDIRRLLQLTNEKYPSYGDEPLTDGTFSSNGAPTPLGPDISVAAPPRQAEPPYVPPEPPIDMPGVRPHLSQQQLAEMMGADNLPQRQGMFGVKGTLRDVLGLIGDSLLGGAKMKPIYAPIRERENLSDAMSGFTDNPQQAIQALLGAGRPDVAMALQEQAANIAWKKEQQALLRDKTVNESGNDERKSYADGVKLFGQAAGAVARIKDPKLRERYLPALQKIKDTYGLGEEFYIPGPGEEFDPALYEAYLSGGTPATVQYNAPFTERRIDLQERNTEANELRASRAPQGRAPRAETSDEREIRLGNTPADQLSPGEASWLAGRPSRNRRGRGSGTSSTPSGGGRKSVFRNGKLVPQ